ncbi:MAG: AmmeMemoRadiSam system protein B [Chloroflexota bacterium]
MDAQAIEPRSVRQSPIAGSWYPGAPDALKQTVDDYLAAAEFCVTDDELVSLISPCSGYLYSGQTAAYAYRQLEKRKYDTVVLVGPCQYDNFGPCAISAQECYWTPLGAVELDQEFIGALSKYIRVTRVERDHESSLEIQLPFLQRMLGDFKLVPIMLSLSFYFGGEITLGPCEQLASVLAELARAKSVLFVASSCLSALTDYKAVKQFDARTEELVSSFNVPKLVRYMWETSECRAGGDASIVTALLAAKSLGADHPRVLYRTNSGDVDGSRERAEYVVGYMAAGIYRSKKAKIPPPKKLLSLEVYEEQVQREQMEKWKRASRESYAAGLVQKLEKDRREMEKRLKQHMREIGKYK